MKNRIFIKVSIAFLAVFTLMFTLIFNSNNKTYAFTAGEAVCDSFNDKAVYNFGISDAYDVAAFEVDENGVIYNSSNSLKSITTSIILNYSGPYYKVYYSGYYFSFRFSCDGNCDCSYEDDEMNYILGSNSKKMYIEGSFDFYFNGCEGDSIYINVGAYSKFMIFYSEIDLLDYHPGNFMNLSDYQYMYDEGYAAGVGSIDITSDNQDVYDEAYAVGNEEGYESGYTAGYTAGKEDDANNKANYDAGYNIGFTAGVESVDQDNLYNSGYQSGSYDGYKKGYAAGVESVDITTDNQTSYDKGYNTGYSVGLNEGTTEDKEFNILPLLFSSIAASSVVALVLFIIKKIKR